MQVKLTLRIDNKLIQHAKIHSKKSGKSLSQLVADYFTLINDQKMTIDDELAPVTRSLRGSLAGKKVGVKDYQRYLEEKYL